MTIINYVESPHSLILYTLTNIDGGAQHCFGDQLITVANDNYTINEEHDSPISRPTNIYEALAYVKEYCGFQQVDVTVLRTEPMGVFARIGYRLDRLLMK